MTTSHKRQSLSDRHYLCFRSLFHIRCPDCGGFIPLGKLTGRGRGWPQHGACKTCGQEWRVALTHWQYTRRFVFRCVPLVLVSVFVMSGLVEYFIPALTYELNGLTKLSFPAFVFLLPASVLPALWWARRLPLEKVERCE